MTRRTGKGNRKIIDCAYCGAGVAPTATACPGCGGPLRTPPPAPSPAAVKIGGGSPLATIQATGKPLKVHRLIAGGLIWGGVIVLALSLAIVPPSRALVGLGLGGMVIGVVWGLATDIRIWWHHA